MKCFVCTENDQTLLYHYYSKIVRNMNLRSWLEQKSGKGVGGNGGKFLERENANWKGEHIWGWNGPPCIGPYWHCINLGNVFGRYQIATRTAYFTLSHCHPSGHFPPSPCLTVLWDQKKCRIPVGDWRATIPVGHKHFSGWNSTTSFLLIITLLQCLQSLNTEVVV